MSEIIVNNLFITNSQHDRPITTIKVLDENCFLSTSNDRSMNIWKMNSFELEKTVCHHRDFVTNISFNNNCGLVATCSYDNSIFVYNKNNWNVQAVLENGSYVYGCCFSEDGKFLYSGDDFSKLKKWDLCSRLCVNSLTLDYDGINDVSISFDNKYLGLSLLGNDIILCDPNTLRVLKIFQGHEQYVRSCEFDRKNSSILTSSDDSKCKLWEIDSMKCLWTFDLKDWALTAKFFDNDRFVVCSTRCGKVTILSSKNGCELKNFYVNIDHSFAAFDISSFSLNNSFFFIIGGVSSNEDDSIDQSEGLLKNNIKGFEIIVS
eukprot:TRINITY_DN642_c0_g1_i1.p1 TRINITY_DN642_c0_g1~~TRINITY_DN642_c0_g1_i1.p1  ORF type:complete len:331 (+),score=85.66 TRINITY_DN642_c0_g1_i1:37-993(+)